MSHLNKNFKPSKSMESFMDTIDWITYELPPGPPMIPQRYYINLHKGGIGVYFLGLMYYYDNWSLGAYLYLFMHGSYGLFWLLKDYVFPDMGFARPCTIASWLMTWPIALCPYMLPGYWMMSR